jgi:hypothetical protein
MVVSCLARGEFLVGEVLVGEVLVVRLGFGVLLKRVRIVVGKGVVGRGVVVVVDYSGEG